MRTRKEIETEQSELTRGADNTSDAILRALEIQNELDLDNRDLLRQILDRLTK